MIGFGDIPGGVPNQGVEPPKPYTPENESKDIRDIRERYVIGELEDPQSFLLQPAGTPGCAISFDYTQTKFNSIIFSVQTGVGLSFFLGNSGILGVPPTAHILVPTGLPVQFMFPPKGRWITIANPSAAGTVTGSFIAMAA